MSDEVADEPFSSNGVNIDTMDLGVGPPTVLRPVAQPIAGWLAVSVFGHGSILVFAVVLALFGRACSPRGPVVDLDKAIEVSMVVLPKSQTNMPDRAARAPVPKGEVAPEVPPPDIPPPVKQSDLVHQTDTPDPKPKGVTDDERRKQLMEQMERQRLLEELSDVAEGPVDRDATDPNSTSDEAINALGAGARGDPEFAKYVAMVQQIFMQHFRPLAAISQSNPKLVTKVLIRVDETGRITSSEISASSGVPAFDAAATRAVTDVGNIPPPPERFRPLAAAGYEVNFRAP